MCWQTDQRQVFPVTERHAWSQTAWVTHDVAIQVLYTTSQAEQIRVCLPVFWHKRLTYFRTRETSKAIVLTYEFTLYSDITLFWVIIL
jgi:hypothetical protein